MRATFADFTIDPPRFGNGTARYIRCHPDRDRLAIGAGGRVELDFALDDGELPEQLTLTLIARVSPLGESLGWAPIDITVNGHAVISRFTVPGGARPREVAFAVPGEALVAGLNTLCVRGCAEARGLLWLYRISVEPSRICARTHLMAEERPAEAAVCAYRTEWRAPGSAEWRPAPRLLVHLDRGEGSLPVRLAWRGQDGAEASIGFQPAMTEFYGHRRAADGTLTEYRGVLEGRSPLRDSALEEVMHRFRTVEGCGSGGPGLRQELRLLIEDGGPPVERVIWGDPSGHSGTVSLLAAEPGPEAEVTDLVTRVRAHSEFAEAGEVAENLLHDSWHKWLGHGDRAWLEFTLRRPVAVGHYVLTSADDVPGRDPKDWTLKGSNDGEHWADLDSRVEESFAHRHQPRGFTFAATTAYRHYRLEITRNAGEDQIQLSQVRLFTSAPQPKGFIGHYQRAGEAPTGYRGTSVSAVPEPGSVTGPPRTVEQWRSYLAEYSATILRVADEDELSEVDDGQRAAGWLGFEGADEESVLALEERLGTRLPPSYRTFLGASDGWLNISPFMWRMRPAKTVGWLREADPETWSVIRGGAGEDWDDTAFMDRALLVSEEGDAQHWLLDPADVSEDGEWAAYIWASWYPALGDRHASFAELVVEERKGFEARAAHEVRMGRPGTAEDLVAEGRAQALRGEVRKAMATFEQAAVKGSGAGAYLGIVLGAFLDISAAHHWIRTGILGDPRVLEAIGMEQLRAEAAPLYLRCAAEEWTGAPGGYLSALGDILPRLPDGVDGVVGAGGVAASGAATEGDDTAAWMARAAAFAPPVLPESRTFQQALDLARALADRGATDQSWAVLEAALPHWQCDSPHRIAPVVLLTDPAFREVVTPARARRVVTTPRGEFRE
ncbi:discoidin domain-containing protein [Streptomyces sp. DASNCL29]|uniref:discoidin domain-containing protein n=1 Tax=Streptomyces sp. DASNCL29 TaxID=2583819 RepID=UPI00110F927E|nr:discoidin domain-containing protein [Streptomyces sp. DASNCL29]TMU99528.1 SMI1/KNR4 family protein [Streptomyces sp. DASNCL29]